MQSGGHSVSNIDFEKDARRAAGCEPRLLHEALQVRSLRGGGDNDGRREVQMTVSAPAGRFRRTFKQHSHVRL